MRGWLLGIVLILATTMVADARHHRHYHHRHHHVYDTSAAIGGRPPGCPYQFCGCGVSLKVFGRIIPELNRAAAWYRFRQTNAAPGMVAVRGHHVMQLEQETRPGVWMVYDPNGGYHLTWRHERSIAGYTIVDPNERRSGVEVAEVRETRHRYYRRHSYQQQPLVVFTSPSWDGNHWGVMTWQTERSTHVKHSARKSQGFRIFGIR